MKICVLTTPLDKASNPYVGTLVESINRQYGDIEWKCDLNSIWDDDIVSYDIVHIHWPQQLLVNRSISIKEVERLMQKLKDANVKIVSTCHNFEPHYTTNPDKKKAYELVYKNADLMFHLGKFSLHVMEQKFPQCKHVLLYHHIYDKLYPQIYSKEESRERLHLSQDGKYALCFGVFRDDEERKFIGNLAKELSKDGINIIAPTFVNIHIRKNLFITLKDIIKYYKEKLTYRNIVMKRHFISDDDLPYYYGAADVALLQRFHILNSGNVPLAFWMGKVVVGPNTGNVRDLLDDFGNPTYDVTNPMTAVSAIKKAIMLAEQGLGKNNRNNAKELFSTDTVAKHMYECYKSLLG